MWAVLCGHAPLPKRFCVWAAFCGAVLLTSMLVGCLCGPPSLPPPLLCLCFFSSFQSSASLSFLSVRGGGGGVIGPWDSRHFSRVTSGVRFCLWAVLCGHAPLPKRFCVWAAFCGAILLTSMLVGCLWGPPSAPPPPAHAFSWGGGRFMG